MVQENMQDRKQGEIYIISEEFLDSEVYELLNIINPNKKQKTSNVSNEGNQKSKNSNSTTSNKIPPNIEDKADDQQTLDGTKSKMKATEETEKPSDNSEVENKSKKHHQVAWKMKNNLK